MRRKRAAILGLVISVAAILALGYFLTPRISFNTKNPRWNGHSELKSTYEPTELASLGDLQARVSRPTAAALLILGPSKGFSEAEAQEVGEFVENGGRLVLADDFGSGNDLLEEMGAEARFSEVLLRDPVFKIKDPKIPKVFEFTDSPFVEGTSSLALNSASTIAETGPGCRVLARSSRKSFMEENQRGPFPVLCEVERGEGEMILISDSSLFINTMLKRENNRELLGNLIGGRITYLDTSHWKRSAFVKFQDFLLEIYGALNRIEVKYGLLLLLTAFIFKIGLGKREKEAGDKDSEVKEVLKRHPQWNEETLKRLQEERNP